MFRRACADHGLTVLPSEYNNIFKAELTAGEQKHDVKMELSFRCGSESQSPPMITMTNTVLVPIPPRITTIKAWMAVCTVLVRAILAAIGTPAAIGTCNGLVV